MSMIKTHPRPFVYDPKPVLSIQSILSKAWIRLQVMNDLARSRRSLGRLSDIRLRDVGLSRHAALSEANKPRWDMPASWGR